MTNPAEPRERRVDGADGLLESLLEGLTDSHDFSDRLHRRRETARDTGELLQVPTRDLDDEVVEGRLEACRGVLGNRVLDLVEGDVETELRGGVGERVTGGLRGEGGRTGETGVDLDDAVLLRVGVERVLDVALSDDTEMTDDVDGGSTEHVVVGVGEGLGGGDDDGVTGVDTKRVEILCRCSE
jgi:hypothetical protein